jgi:hypothetical protein
VIGRKAGVALLCICCVAADLQVRLVAQETPQRHGRLFPPQDLGLLEIPDRAAWQKPDQIMDALGIADGSTSPDIGPGAGWFTFDSRIVSGRAGWSMRGRQPEMLEATRRRVTREGSAQCRTRLGTGTGSESSLKARLDAVLVRRRLSGGRRPRHLPSQSDEGDQAEGPHRDRQLQAGARRARTRSGRRRPRRRDRRRSGRAGGGPAHPHAPELTLSVLTEPFGSFAFELSERFERFERSERVERG